MTRISPSVSKRSPSAFRASTRIPTPVTRNILLTCAARTRSAAVPDLAFEGHILRATEQIEWAHGRRGIRAMQQNALRDLRRPGHGLRDGPTGATARFAYFGARADERHVHRIGEDTACIGRALRHSPERGKGFVVIEYSRPDHVRHELDTSRNGAGDGRRDDGRNDPLPNARPRQNGGHRCDAHGARHCRVPVRLPMES